MDIYSQILLQFAYGLQNSFARVENIRLLAQTIERITGIPEEQSNTGMRWSAWGPIRGWSGGTLIAPASPFNSGAQAYDTALLSYTERRVGHRESQMSWARRSPRGKGAPESSSG